MIEHSERQRGKRIQEFPVCRGGGEPKVDLYVLPSRNEWREPSGKIQSTLLPFRTSIPIRMEN